MLVCGSLAMDHLLRHHGSFKTYQETYGADALNASLPISEYRTCYGGCGGNIAYGLGVLGVPTVLLSHAGRDFFTITRTTCSHTTLIANSWRSTQSQNFPPAAPY